MKRIWLVLIISLSVVALYHLVIRPAFCRGTVEITVENNTRESLSIISINDKELNKSVKPDGKITITYKVDSCPYVLLKFDSVFLSDLTELEVISYIEPMYYGTVRVTATYDEEANTVTFQTQENIRF